VIQSSLLSASVKPVNRTSSLVNLVDCDYWEESEQMRIRRHGEKRILGRERVVLKADGGEGGSTSKCVEIEAPLGKQQQALALGATTCKSGSSPQQQSFQLYSTLIKRINS
jgi:hypothetical protein